MFGSAGPATADKEALLDYHSGEPDVDRPTNSLSRTQRSSSLLPSMALRLLVFMLPSFLRKTPNVTSPKTTEKSVLPGCPQRPSTEYLDGVRGVASVVVFVFHWTHIQFPRVNSGYDGNSNLSLWQLPIIRLVYSGAAMVSIFFAVSGFVLTHRFIQKMHSGDWNGLYPSLTSLAFRRAVRLFLPALASCVLAYTCACLGLISVPANIGHKPFHHGFWALLQYLDKETDPWTWEPFMKGFYNPQLWSISLEFRGSMVVFLTVLGLAKSRLSVRLLVEGALVVHAFLHKRWDIGLFVAGMMLAELDVWVYESSAAKKLMRKKAAKVVLVLAMMIGIWLSGYPRDNGPQSLGYKTISKHWPHSGYRRRFWVSVGSILIVGPLSFFPCVQAIFNTRVVKYFGKVSFALYLIHGLGNRTVGTWILRATWRFIGNGTVGARTFSYIVSSAAYVPIIFWWSDMFWRAFDAPSTRFAKWLESKCASRPTS